MFQDWLNLYAIIRKSTVAGSGHICPECGANSIVHQFVGDVKKKIGYVDMWCTTCNRGIHMSRVLVSEGESMISFDVPSEVISDRIPNFEQVVPTDNQARR